MSEPKCGDRQYTVKTGTFGGYIVMVRVRNSFSWGDWFQAGITDLNEIIRRLAGHA